VFELAEALWRAQESLHGHPGAACNVHGGHRVRYPPQVHRGCVSHACLETVAAAPALPGTIKVTTQVAV